MIDREKALEDALTRLIKLYVMNLGSDGEFLSCVTAKSARDMDFFQRKTSKHWSAWDDARILVSPPPPDVRKD